MAAWMRAANKYIKDKCNDKGETSGLKKLLKRTKQGEIVKTTTDKSSKLCVNSIENYTTWERDHTKEDREVTWEEVEDIQRRLSGHCSAWTKIFKIDEDWGTRNEARVKGAHCTSTLD